MASGWLYDEPDDDDAGEDTYGEYGIWSEFPENYPADNDFADD